MPAAPSYAAANPPTPPVCVQRMAARWPTWGSSQQRTRPIRPPAIPSTGSRSPSERVLRVHAPSRTSGKPKVLGRSQGDIVHVVDRYGLFTGGQDAHQGAQKLYCTVPHGASDRRRPDRKTTAAERGFRPRHRNGQAQRGGDPRRAFPPPSQGHALAGLPAPRQRRHPEFVGLRPLAARPARPCTAAAPAANPSSTSSPCERRLVPEAVDVAASFVLACRSHALTARVSLSVDTRRWRDRVQRAMTAGATPPWPPPGPHCAPQRCTRHRPCWDLP